MHRLQSRDVASALEYCGLGLHLGQAQTHDTHPGIQIAGLVLRVVQGAAFPPLRVGQYTGFPWVLAFPLVGKPAGSLQVQ